MLVSLDKYFGDTANVKFGRFTASVTWDQALFSFRFENYIPAGKLGLISGYGLRQDRFFGRLDRAIYMSL